MKQLKDFIENINESTQDDINIIVQNSGSGRSLVDNIKTLMKIYKNENVNLYYFDQKGVHKTETIKYIPFNGPHTGDYDMLYKFNEEHMGDITIILTN